MQYDQIKSILRGVLQPHYFFVAPGGHLRVEFVPEQWLPWELHAGQLLPPTMIRRQRCFATWNVWFSYPDPDPAPASADASHNQPAAAIGPLLSVCYDKPARQFHVVRGFAIYGQQAYEQQPNVIATREVQLWMRELVSTIDCDAHDLPDRLRHALFRATIGTSRLAITSLQSPLPDFSLGRLAYLPADDPTAAARRQPLDCPNQLIERTLAAGPTHLVGVKSFEFALRASSDNHIESLAQWLWQQWRQADRSASQLVDLLQRVFNEVVLAPHTAFGQRLVRLITALGHLPDFGVQAEIDLLGYMLRQLTRHLTAYDLVLFHNLGANYPDAFLLDDLLKAYLQCIVRCPEAFVASDNLPEPLARRRRRALRQAWVLRKTYELHPVPDQPCSAGDRIRVLPPPYQRLSEEQVTSLAKRRRRLFEGDLLHATPNTPQAAVLTQSLHDLAHDAELRELGTAIYLDRPLGWFRPPTAADGTLLFSYEAFSRRVAEKRLRALAERWHLIDSSVLERHIQRLRSMPHRGIRASDYQLPSREGVVCLEDACRAADDFCFVRSTRSSLNQLLADYDFTPLQPQWPETFEWLHTAANILLIRLPRNRESEPLVLAAFDHQGQPRLELEVAGNSDANRHVEYIEYAGQHWLKHGLSVRRVAHPSGNLLDVRSQNIELPPRLSVPQ